MFLFNSEINDNDQWQWSMTVSGGVNFSDFPLLPTADALSAEKPMGGILWW